MTPSSYENFDLLIEPVNGKHNCYSVRVIDSPHGNAKGSFELSFTDEQLAHIRDIASLELQAAEEFGHTLFTSVFVEDIRTCLEVSFQKVKSEGRGLRLRLRMSDADALSELPWELLFDKRTHGFFAHSTVSPLVRYLDVHAEPKPLHIVPPLKILIVVAIPHYAYLAPLDTDVEWQKIQSALEDLQIKGQVELTYLKTANLNMLSHQLDQDNYHIFHYIGHGKFGSLPQRSCCHLITLEILVGVYT